MARHEELTIGKGRIRELYLGPDNGGLGVQVTATPAELNTIDLSAVGALVKVKKIAVNAVLSAAEQLSGWDLPAKAIVVDILLDVKTAEATGATKTIDIGTDGTGSNDPDGFADALSVAAIGIKRPQAAITVGATESYFATNLRGALLSYFLAGADVAGDVGTYQEFPDVTSGGEEITWTFGSADFVELVSDLYIAYIELG